MSPMFRKTGRRRGRNAQDGRSVALSAAGMRLLARKDYEAISMAEIAREAGCSIDTVYDRYSNKDSYLCRVIAHAFHSMTDRAKLALDPNGLRRASAKIIVQEIVSHSVSQMTAPQAAGAIRATLKLATVKPLALEPFEDYRSAVTDLAVDLLAGKIRQPPTAIRIGIQIVFGTITDAILQKHPGPMNAGSARMIDALTKVLLGYLGLAKGGSWAGDEADAEDEPEDAAEIGSETPPELEEGEIAIFDPDMRTFVGKRPDLRQKQRKRRKGVKANDADMVVGITEGKSPTVKPSKQAAAKSAATSSREKQPSRSARKRHRVI